MLALLQSTAMPLRGRVPARRARRRRQRGASAGLKRRTWLQPYASFVCAFCRVALGVHLPPQARRYGASGAASELAVVPAESQSKHTSMAYTAEIRRVGGSLYKAARGSSNLFLPDTCFLNTVRPAALTHLRTHTLTL